MARGCTRRPKATFSNTVMWRNSASCWNTNPTWRSLAPCPSASSPSIRTSPASGQSRPAMIRNSVVLPEPEGPSSASNSPLPTFRSTLSSAANAPNFLTMFLTSMVTWIVPCLSFVETPFENSLHDQRDQGQHRQQRGNRKRRHELILIVEDLDQQRHGVGLAADMARHDRHRAEFPHGARVAQQYAIQ